MSRWLRSQCVCATGRNVCLLLKYRRTRLREVKRTRFAAAAAVDALL